MSIYSSFWRENSNTLCSCVTLYWIKKQACILLASLKSISSIILPDHSSDLQTWIWDRNWMKPNSTLQLMRLFCNTAPHTSAYQSDAWDRRESVLSLFHILNIGVLDELLDVSKCLDTKTSQVMTQSPNMVCQIYIVCLW